MSCPMLRAVVLQKGSPHTGKGMHELQPYKQLNKQNWGAVASKRACVWGQGVGWRALKAAS